jgi:chromosome segregation ATPase
MVDIKQAIEEVNELEIAQAKLEMRVNQLNDRKKTLIEELGELGISPEELENEIGRIEKDITDKLNSIPESVRPQTLRAFSSL